MSAAPVGGATVDERTCDVVVVGAGVAGLVTALDLLELRPSARIVVLEKGVAGETGSTPLAQGGMAAAVGADDAPMLHAADTLTAADGLADPYAVRVMAVEGPARVADLVRRGARFDRVGGAADGPLALAREGGQAVARSVRAADATGAEIFRALRAAAGSRVERVQGVAVALAERPDGAGVCGAWVLLDPLAEGRGRDDPGRLTLLRAPAVVLATGGCGGMYDATTNRDSATADGVALAYAASAALIDLEFVQFHPTGLALAEGATPHGPTGSAPPSTHWRQLLTEALRGAGAVLVDERGARFMVGRHPDAELAPRHVVTRGILDQPGGAWLDARHLGAARLEEEFPTVLAGARANGHDLASAPVPVAPTQHYMIGGVATTLDGATSVPGLWAVGEVASVGVHGANRMAGNSLLQSCVFAHRTAGAVDGELARSVPVGEDPPLPPLAPASAADRTHLLAATERLRAAMSAGAGPLRTADGLRRAAAVVDEVDAAIGPRAARRESIEAGNLAVAARLLVRSALLREESRGAHVREDHPERSPAWEGVRLRVAAPSAP